jgi:hypothetical protein
MSKNVLNKINDRVDYAQVKLRKQIVYMIFLFISLFSIAFIFFSNAITKIDVSIDGGTKEYVEIAAMYSITQVIFLMVLVFVATTCLLLVYIDFNKSDKTIKKRKNIGNLLEGEAKVLYEIIAEKGEILQKDLVFESGFSKVKVTRILRKLSDKQLIIMKPWGNTNKVLVD